MRFTDYILDRLLYILFYFISIALVIVIMSLDSINRDIELNIENILYAILISIVMLIAFLAIDYLRKRQVYRAITRGLERDNFDYIFNIPDRANREHRAFKKLLTKNHMYYENTLDSYRKKFKSQLNLKSRWIHQLKTPTIILSDEPTGNLDSKASMDLMESLETINRKRGATIVMVTHDAFAASFCKRIVMIKDGKFFLEIVKSSTRQVFFKEILDALSLIGGGYNETI